MGATPMKRPRISLSKTAMANLTKIIKDLEVSTNTKVKLLQTTVFPAVLYGCKGKKIKERLMSPCTVRMNASATAQALPGNSGHIQQIQMFWTYNAQLRLYEKSFDVRTDIW
jgi:hypothetical protein